MLNKITLKQYRGDTKLDEEDIKALEKAYERKCDKRHKKANLYRTSIWINESLRGTKKLEKYRELLKKEHIQL